MANLLYTQRLRVMDGDRCRYTLPVKVNGEAEAMRRAKAIAKRLADETGRKMRVESYRDLAGK